MANYIIQDTTLTAIADAIRTKDGSSEPILTENMATKILNIPTGGITPEYTETKIADNHSQASSFTFTEDYHNYQMLNVILYSSTSGNYEAQLVTPEGIDQSILYSANRINFNMLENNGQSNQYVCYTAGASGVPSLTWSRYGSRNTVIYEVYGVTFTNVSLTKTEIYSRKAISSANVTPTPPADKTFFDFDAIMYMSCSGASDETQFARDWFVKDSMDIYGNGYYTRLFVKYNSSWGVRIRPTSIGTGSYFYIVGLNFT